ncbi:MAG: hypothetical protein U0270_29850 [Labilithrix sp.]
MLARRLLLPLAFSTAACALLTSFDGFDEPKTQRDDGGSLELDAGVEAASSCHKQVPDPPRTGGSSKNAGSFVAAARSMTFVGSPGFDLDVACTCPAPASCRGAKPDQPCDADGGVDNAAADLFAFASVFLDGGLDESGLALGLSRGRYGLLFKIDGWNGERNDDAVAVSFANAFDVVPEGAGARFDGSDVWRVDEESYIPNSTIPAYPAESWVKDGVLVARFVRLPLKLRIPTVNDRWLLLPVAIEDATMSARLEAGGGGVTLTKGELGGRLSMASVFRIIQSVGGCLEPASATTPAIVSNLCARRDIMLASKDDNRDLGCDALSVGIAFEATPAKVADTPGVPTDEAPCASGVLPTCP